MADLGPNAPHQYRRAPIIEAVFDVQFDEKLSERDMGRARVKFVGPQVKSEDLNQIALDIKDGKAGQTRTTLIGHKLTFPNAVDVVLIRADGFGTARMAPYENWERFTARAFENLDQFTKVVGRKTFKRIATRFVNRFDIPSQDIEGRDVTEWLSASVALPASLGATIGPYSLAVNFVHEGTGVKALVQSGIVAPALLKHVSINLDIDVYVDSQIDAHKDEVVRIAPKLRAAKNSIFEALITEKLRATFK